MLQTELGPKTSETLHEQARGIDRRPLDYEHERKSVSADVNYGIRFKTQDEALNFLRSLSTEVHNRLIDTGMRARCLTLKLLIRAKGAPVVRDFKSNMVENVDTKFFLQETAKFLGCGVCDSINKSTTSGAVITDPNTIFKEAKLLFEKINVPCTELRGVGIQLTKLEKIPPVNTALSNFLKQGTSKKDVEEAKINVAGPSKAIAFEKEKSKENANSLKRTASNSSIEKKMGKSSRGRGRGRATTSATTNLYNYFKSKNSPNFTKVR